jgi:hypothetical protein
MAGEGWCAGGWRAWWQPPGGVVLNELEAPEIGAGEVSSFYSVPAHGVEVPNFKLDNIHVEISTPGFGKRALKIGGLENRWD